MEFQPLTYCCRQYSFMLCHPWELAPRPPRPAGRVFFACPPAHDAVSKRVLFLVDGFNLYHSLVDIQGVAKASVKWLDLRALCTSYLQAVRNEIGERVELSGIYYFSARPDHLAHRNPGVLTRFDTYMSALRSTDIEPILAQFKKKEVYCYRCKETFDRREEKETDVALGLKLIEALFHKECDTAVIISGDTDLIPAIRTAQRLFPDIPLGVGFPFLL